MSAYRGHVSIPACRPPGAFTLIEMLIVLTILGILAAIVVPRFSDASQSARDNALKDDLRYLRTQITVFKAQHHDVPPGYPAGDVTAAPTPADFLSQMTGHTNDLCQVGATAAYNLGPYIPEMPRNPLNGLATVMLVANNAAIPAPDNSTGWIYKPQTLEIIPNLIGADSEARSYTDY